MLLTLLALAGHGCGTPPSPEQPPRTLVRVNGDPITERDVNRRLGAALGDSGRDRVDAGVRQRLTEQAVEAEILDTLLLQAAVSEGYSASAAEVEADLSRTRELMGEEAFASMLERQGAAPGEYREFLRRQLLIKRYRQALYEGIRIAEPALKEYFEGHRERFAVPETVRLHLLVFEGEAAADAARQRLQAGDAFEEVARDHIESGGGATRTRPMPLEAVPEGLRDLIDGADVGEVRRYNEADRIYLVRLIERSPGRSSTFEEAREDVEEALMGLRRRKLLDDWYEAQLKRAKIEHIREP